MLTLIKTPTVIDSVGNKPKRIEEYVGLINSATETLSIAKMVSAGGWEEPGQTPEFAEYTLVLVGMLRLETLDGMQDVSSLQLTIHADRGSFMKSKPVVFLFADLGITKTHSRPYPKFSSIIVSSLKILFCVNGFARQPV